MRIPKDSGATPPVDPRREDAATHGPATARPKDTIGIRFDPDQFGAHVAREWRALRPPIGDKSAPATWLRKTGAPVIERANPHLPKGTSARLHLMPSPSARVVSMPGGDVFVTTGRMVEAKSSQEVREALAGELAHLALGHATQRLVESAGPAAVEQWIQRQDPKTAAAIARQFDAEDRLRDYAPAERDAALRLAGRWMAEMGSATDDDQRQFEAARRALIELSEGAPSPRRPLPDGRAVLLVMGGLVGIVVLARTCG